MRGDAILEPILANCTKFIAVGQGHVVKEFPDLVLFAL